MNIDMNILFDLVTPQGFIGGAGEYVRKVFYTLLDSVKSDDTINLYVAIDTTKGQFAYKDLSPESLAKLSVKVVDLGKQSLSSCVEEYKINTVFIGMAQAWGGRYDVQNLQCRVICVVHDICDEENASTKLELYLRLYQPWKFFKKVVRLFLKLDQAHANRMIQITNLFNSNNRVDIVTVSEYSKKSIEYFLGYDSNRIHVLYSPERVGVAGETIENDTLSSIIKGNKKYYLMLAANRPEKNPEKVLAAFKKYSEQVDKDSYIITTGKIEKHFENHIVLPYLSDSDLMNVYKYCYAFIFPSFFEGFGYPPMEAMKFGKPVLASNVTSIPEILGGAAMFFSPYYESDIYRCLVSLDNTNYASFCNESKMRYEQISKLQNEDLVRLIALIIDK